MTDRSIMTAVYTDGACKGNPGPGGWGVFVDSEEPVELFGGERHTTNNRMELKAVIEAVRWYSAQPLDKVIFYLDSEYVRKGTTEWMWGWKARNWMSSTRQPVKNGDLWKELDELLGNVGKPIDWRWVKGHSGNRGNERADTLANRGASEQRQQEAAPATAAVTAEAMRAAICKHLPGAARHQDRLNLIVKELGL